MHVKCTSVGIGYLGQVQTLKTSWKQTVNFKFLCNYYKHKSQGTDMLQRIVCQLAQANQN